MARCSRHWWRGLPGLAVLGIAVATLPLRAQTFGQGVSTETRAMLETQAKQAEAMNRTEEAFVLRQRLQHGDFREGDRIVVQLLGTAAMTSVLPKSDTITLRAGKLMEFPQMEPLSLEGVLRSEATEKVQAHLSKYLRDASVQVTPLVRIGILGKVRAPGYVYTTLDLRLGDVLTQAGAWGPNGDFAHISARRGNQVLWTPQDIQTALRDGFSLDQLRLQPGDEIIVEDEKGGFNWQAVLQGVGYVAGILYAVRSFIR
jgi:protein involved in polysaccharide export with SLBB domain